MINKNEIKRQMEWYICGDGRGSREYFERNSMDFVDDEEWFFYKIAYTFNITIEYVRLIAEEIEKEHTKLWSLFATQEEKYETKISHLRIHRPARNLPNGDRIADNEYCRLRAEYDEMLKPFAEFKPKESDIFKYSWNEVKND